MDFIPGTNLLELWNDWSWLTEQKREKIFEQTAGWMTELSALEFDQIGCLDWDEASGTHHIVPFPDSSTLLVRLGQDSEEPDSTAVPAGPFNTAHEYLSFILSLRRRISDSSILAILQLFLSALLTVLSMDPLSRCVPLILTFRMSLSITTASSPESLTGMVYGLCLAKVGQQRIPHDWVPISYGWKKDTSPEDNMRHDSPTELASYRRAYLDRSRAHVTLNSHIWTTLHNAICSQITASGIVLDLSRFVFGSSVCDVEQGMRGSAWFALRNAPEAIAEKIYHGDTNGEGDSDGTNEGSAVDSDGTGGGSVEQSEDGV
jgi:hypothetical protein